MGVAERKRESVKKGGRRRKRERDEKNRGKESVAEEGRRRRKERGRRARQR